MVSGGGHDKAGMTKPTGQDDRDLLSWLHTTRPPSQSSSTS